jgi:rSAM/selenodomain-associated transferase 2
MISIVIPTLNAEDGLARTLAALVPAAVDGLVRELIVVDGGSSDGTLHIAEAAGAEIMRSEAGRGAQLAAGAKRARFPWLLFLHADTELEPGWIREASQLIEGVETGRRPQAAAAFRFALDDAGAAPRTLEALVALRTRLFKLPYGDQGLLVSRALYEEAGGFRPLPLMEDVDLVRRIGRRRIVLFRSQALTSAVRYRREGYLRRIARNQACLALYFLNVPPPRIAQLYARGPVARPNTP